MIPMVLARTRGLMPVRTALALLSPVLLVSCSMDTDGVTVYAASSLSLPLEKAAQEYKKKTGTRILTRLESSSRLAREIENGAPADLYIAADIAWMDYLAKREIVDTEGSRLLAWNRLVCVVPNTATASSPSNFLAMTILERIAMGDPQAAPIGQYTQEALIELGGWDRIQDRLVMAPNARGVLALVERREVDGGFVYASDARSSDRVKIAFEIDEKSHDPIVYTGATVRGSERLEEAAGFLNFLAGSEGKAIFREFGLGGT